MQDETKQRAAETMDHASFRTETGPVRSRNEDAVLLRAWPGAEHATLMVVADGMGSYSGGDVAARLVIDEFAKLLESPLPTRRSRRCEALLGAFYGADESIRRATDFRRPDMGATAVAAIATRSEIVHLYAGDCRLYHIRGGRMIYRTRDHSAVQVLVDSGRLSESQAREHPMRSTVTSCLGGPAPAARLTIDPSSWFDTEPTQADKLSPYRRLQAGDRIVLCSDGLWSGMPDAQLAAICSRTKSAHELVQRCVAFALHADGTDNVSMIALEADAAPKSHAATPRRRSGSSAREDSGQTT